MKFKISLSEKLLLSIGSLIALTLVAVLYISHTMVLASFVGLENQEIRTNVRRAQKSIDGELKNLTSICEDWAQWDDTRDFVLGQSPDYNTGNLSASALANLNLNFMIFVDTSGRMFHITVIDIEEEAFVETSQSLIDHILADKVLLDLKDPSDSKSGLVIMPEEIALVASMQISNSRAEGPVSGTLIIGRFLNDNLIKTLSRRTSLDISIAGKVDNAGLAETPDSEKTVAKLFEGGDIVVKLLDKDNAAGFTNIYDIDDNVYITLEVKVPRTIYNQGRHTVFYFIVVIASTVMVMLAALLLVMQKIILRPINRLTKNLTDIGDNYDANTKLYTERNDEIGSLARSFDIVTENLKKRVSELNRSEKRFEEVAENSGDWIWEVNTEGLYTYSSPVVEELLGYTPQEIVGKNYFYDFFAPDRREELKKAAFEAFAKQEKFGGFVNPNIHKNGSAVILETHGAPIIDDRGNLCGYRGADRDITERKRVEERLLAVNELQKVLLPPAPIELKLNFITNAVVRIINADFARIWTIKPGDRCDAGCIHADVKDGPHICRFRDKCLHLVASSGRYTHIDGKVHRRVPFGCYKIGLIAAGREDKFLTNEAATDPRIHDHDWVKELGLVSFAGYRLTHIDGKPLGVLALFSKHPISPEEDAILEGIANSTSMILHTSHTEEVILEKGELYRALFEQANDAIFLMENENFVDCNKRTLEMFGVTREQIINQPPANFSPEFQHGGRSSAEMAAEKIRAAYAGVPQSFEWTHTRPDGTPFDVEVSLNLIKIGGRPLLHAIVRDITDRKQTEKAMRESERKYRELVMLANSIILRWTRDGRITFLNEFGQRFFGYTEAEIYGRHVVGTIVPASDSSGRDLPLLMDEIRANPAAFEQNINENMRRNGEHVWIAWTNKVVLDPQGQVAEILSIGVDITERKKAEEALQKNEEFTRRVIESSNDCIKVLDLEGHLLSMSCGGQKMLELDDASMLLNSSFIDFWKGQEKEGCIEAIEKAKRGGTGIFYGNLKTIKGTPKSFEIVVTPIKDANGGIVSLLAVSRDITARKKAEEAIDNLNKDLKLTVARLTQSNRQLREFAHLAAHDLKTPLRGISTLTQWLVDDYKEKFDDEGRQQANLLVERVDRMGELINAILQYSTITRERDKECPIDINTLVGAILVEIRPPPNIKITINKDLPTVICREAHLRQVFRNLIANAIKFMDKPDGRIIIDYINKKDLWEFSVSDNGPGIAPQHFEKVFQFFQTLADQDGSKGGGMGLTLTRRIIELYDGQIWLTSDLGRGSTFFFTLPKSPSAVNNKKPLLTAFS